MARQRPVARDSGPSAASVVLGAMSEAEFQRYVLQALHRRQWLWWHNPDSRRVNAGMPDLLAVHDDIPVLLALELKGPRTRVTPLQRSVIETMSRVPGVYARIVRPADWPAVLQEIDSWH